MLRNGVSRSLIRNVPVHLGGVGVTMPKEDYRNLVEIIPVRGTVVDYHSDVWDFNDCFKHSKRQQNKILFKRANGQYKNLLKDFVANALDSYQLKVSTISSMVARMTSALNAALDLQPAQEFQFMTSDELIAGIKNTQARADVQRQLLVHFIKFVEFLREDENLDIPIIIDELKRERDKTAYRSRFERINRHHPTIPEEYFEGILKVADKVMRDERQPFNMRMTAGAVLIDSQLGLRISEIPALKTDLLRICHCDDGKDRPYIVYNCIKKARARVETIEQMTICTPLLEKTIRYYLELRAKNRYADSTDFLYILDYSNLRGKRFEGVFPVHQTSFDAFYETFCRNYLVDYNQKKWKGLTEKKYKGRTYVYPTVHSFRVHFAEALYAQEFPLDFINCIMSHTPDSEVEDAYIHVSDDIIRKRREALFNDKEKEPNGRTADEAFKKFLDEMEMDDREWF